MKELSIEEKAKSYDEVVEKAKIEKEKSRNLGLLEFIDENFPELKESEDERVRKEIISAIKEDWPGHTDWIAWLEKQGQKPVYKVEPKFKVKYAGSEYNVLNVKDIAGVTYYGIEDEPNHIDYVLPNNCEIVSEQKPADKVEPKFHDGEWITHNTANFVFKIINVGSNGYEVVNRENYKKTISFDNEDNYHLWTIKDAKDGDVLATSAGAFIYNGNSGGGSCPGSYCGINTLGRFKTGVEHHWTGKKVYPATKEQRDLMFQKIKEEGYKWDAEKKELKHKPAAWNEEDELNFRRALYYVNYYQTHEADTKEAKECFDFLESLKDRVQPKQEWSDEDKKHIMSIKSTIEYCKMQYPDASVVVEAYNSDLIWLSRLQPQWKPTKKQIMALRWVLNHIPYDIHKEEISGLFDQIKEL